MKKRNQTPQKIKTLFIRSVEYKLFQQGMLTFDEINNFRYEIAPIISQLLHAYEIDFKNSSNSALLEKYTSDCISARINIESKKIAPKNIYCYY